MHRCKSQSDGQKCGSTIRLWRLRGDMVDEFSIIFALEFRCKHMEIGQVALFSLSIFLAAQRDLCDVDDSLIWTLSLFLCAQNYNLICVVWAICACLRRWLNRISFATVNCHNWSEYTHAHGYCAFLFAACTVHAFVLLVVNRDFFCGDLTVSYTLLLFTSRFF